MFNACSCLLSCALFSGSMLDVECSANCVCTGSRQPASIKSSLGTDLVAYHKPNYGFSRSVFCAMQPISCNKPRYISLTSLTADRVTCNSLAQGYTRLMLQIPRPFCAQTPTLCCVSTSSLCVQRLVWYATHTLCCASTCSLCVQHLVWCATHTLWTGPQQGPVGAQQQGQPPAMP